MKITVNYLLIGISFLMFNACDNDHLNSKPESNSINKILPLGASRVEGARPEFESYRYELWKDLKENNWDFDFVGTQSDNASYPRFDNENFDIDHEGRGGWTSGQILNGLNGWLRQTGSPDIVLFSSPGGNDLLESLDYNQTISNINAIIDALQANNPYVTIIIEQPAQGRSDFMITDLTNAFNQMREDIVTISANQTTGESQVIAVDMYTGFNDSYLADEVHYNEAGAEFIATRYYNVLITVLEQ
ncbi:GDSL-type esterase/lipase family protein [Rhodohalobacter sulfatireducens]|uniref:GDSL-type esterase/lipase family protein n=1 Tax=Rhodohalobacter sulfatireducens TaxID=2911366 RepID=A0ABS9KDE8_9BACT|nr:GDSL-type esterase/lipase family protein [Rhodohalobacter sulfatireducens]MCG2588855.1 GDSL-type esterase/lipase family protein [Rhodohalobacter sulfatireducens]